MAGRGLHPSDDVAVDGLRDKGLPVASGDWFPPCPFLSLFAHLVCSACTGYLLSFLLCSIETIGLSHMSCQCGHRWRRSLGRCSSTVNLAFECSIDRPSTSSRTPVQAQPLMGDMSG